MIPRCQHLIRKTSWETFLKRNKNYRRFQENRAVSKGDPCHMNKDGLEDNSLLISNSARVHYRLLRRHGSGDVHTDSRMGLWEMVCESLWVAVMLCKNSALRWAFSLSNFSIFFPIPWLLFALVLLPVIWQSILLSSNLVCTLKIQICHWIAVYSLAHTYS